MSLKPPFYVISDTHWLHDNIIKYQKRPYDHDVMMLKRWKRTVKEEGAIVLHLGDLVHWREELQEKFEWWIAPELTGKKYLILGNHDDKNIDYTRFGFTVIKPFSIKYRGYDVSFGHYPKMFEPGEKVIHVHGHIHKNGYGRDEPSRFGNINCSVEVLDYRPHRVTRLLNAEIRRRNQGKDRYRNSRHYRYNKRDDQKLANSNCNGR